MQNHTITIIILNWNGWKNTINCVNSLKTISCTATYKIIIIDNCSSDDSIDRIKAALPEIKLIQNQKNLGFGGGCNVGFKYSIQHNAEYVWLLNNDTTVYTDTLQELLDIAHSDISIGITGSVLYNMDTPEEIQTWGGGYIDFWAGNTKNIYDKKRTAELQYITGASMLIRVGALQQAGMFDDHSFFMYWEDVDLCFRLSKNDWKLSVAEKSKVLHKEGESLKDNKLLLDRYFNQSAAAFFCKHYRFCFIPVFIGLGGRLVKRLIRKDSAGFKEIALILGHQFTNAFLRVFK